MKKRLFNLIPIFLLPVVILPVALTSVSCATTSAKVDVLVFKNLKNKNELTGNYEERNVSYNSLLYGNLSYNEGNYIVFVGSNMYTSTCNFYAGKGVSTRSKEAWYSSSYYSQSILQTAIATSTTGQETQENLQIFLFNDIFDSKFTDTNGKDLTIYQKSTGIGPTKLEIAGPYDTWTIPLINQTYETNRVEGREWDKESVKEGDYIRRDDSANRFRDFTKRGALLYPRTTGAEGTWNESFAVNSGNTTDYTLYFVKGVLKKITTLPAKAEILSEAITTHYKTDK